MKISIWNNKREVIIEEKLVVIAKNANYNINASALELALFCKNITEESDISDEKLNQLCNLFLAEDILTMQEMAKAFNDGTIERLISEREKHNENMK